MFLIMPVGMNYRTSRAPVITLAIIGLCTLFYLGGLPFMLKPESDGALWLLTHFWVIPAFTPWYSYLTAAFFHVGFFHLVGNMLYLFLFGCCVEDLVGRWRFLALYLLSGLGANLAYVALIPDHFNSEIPMCGASGAISACMGAYLLLRSKVDIEFKYFLLFFFRFFSGEFSVAAWVVLSFWFLKDLAFAAVSYYSDQSGGGVAFGAHVGGFLLGAAILGIYKLFPAKTPAKRKPIRVQIHNLAKPIYPAELADAQPDTYIFQAETQYGPYNLFQIRQMLADGSVTSEAQYWMDGMSEWRSVSELAEGAKLPVAFQR